MSSFVAALRFRGMADETGSAGRPGSGDGGLFGSGAAAGHDRGEDPRWNQARARRYVRAGWLGENCFITPDKTAVPTVERCLAGCRYDCVVVGAGVRLPPSRLPLFEAL